MPHTVPPNLPVTVLRSIVVTDSLTVVDIVVTALVVEVVVEGRTMNL